DRTAGVLVDLVVRPEHRTLYPALLLQKQMRQTALGAHSIVYGLPNKNSAPVVRRLGYSQVGELVRYSRVLCHGNYLERRLPRWLSRMLGAVADRAVPFYFKPDRWKRDAWKCTWVESFDARFDALWAHAKAFNGVIGVRDAEFLAWRFSAQPGHQYRTLAMMAPGETGLAGYAVCEPIGTTLHLRDFLVAPSHKSHVHRLIHLLALEAYRQGFFNLSQEFLGPSAWRDSLVAAGMRARDKRMLYASFGPQADAQLGALDWYMTSADEDQ
ncbi:MAG: GNAT family N-acetyltransferase, partial [Burkholderiaceae bacterium]